MHEPLTDLVKAKVSKNAFTCEKNGRIGQATPRKMRSRDGLPYPNSVGDSAQECGLALTKCVKSEFHT